MDRIIESAVGPGAKARMGTHCTKLVVMPGHRFLQKFFFTVTRYQHKIFLYIAINHDQPTTIRGLCSKFWSVLLALRQQLEGWGIAALGHDQVVLIGLLQLQPELRSTLLSGSNQECSETREMQETFAGHSF